MRASLPFAVLLSLGAASGSCGSPQCLPNRAPYATLVTPGDVVHAEGELQGHGGVCLYQQSWRPAGTIRGVIVWVHGLKDHSSRYADSAWALAQSGYAVHALDLRGHGRSGGARGYGGSFDDYLADLDTFVTEVRAIERDRPTFLFGHSMGGAIATAYTLTRHPPLRGLMLSGAALRLGSDVSGFDVGATRFFSAVWPTLGVLSLDPLGFSRDPVTRLRDANDPWIEHGNGAARTAAELIGAIDRIRAHETELTLPLLVMHGEADRITPPEGSRELVAHASSTDKTLHIYPGLYHDLLHEPERGTVLRDMIDWLDAHTQTAMVESPSDTPSASSSPPPPAH